MCTDDHTGGLGCNFEKGICGGVVTELDLDSHWGWTNTTEGPIGTHVDARDSTVVGGKEYTQDVTKHCHSYVSFSYYFHAFPFFSSSLYLCSRSLCFVHVILLLLLLLFSLIYYWMDLRESTFHFRSFLCRTMNIKVYVAVIIF